MKKMNRPFCDSALELPRAVRQATSPENDSGSRVPVDKGPEVVLNEHRNRLRILILVRPFVHLLLRLHWDQSLIVRGCP